MRGAKILKIVGLVLLGVMATVALGLILGFGVMWLWNWLMPDLFGLPQIGYWQALGLYILSHLLLKNHSIPSYQENGKENDKKCGDGSFEAKLHSKLDDADAQRAEDPSEPSESNPLGSGPSGATREGV